MRKIIILVLIFLFFSGYAGAVDIGNDLTISGKIKNETSTLTENLRNFQKIENTIETGAEYRMNDNLQFFLDTRFFYDAVYDAESEYEPLKHEDNLRYSKDPEFWLREAYVDYLSDRLDVRLGKQQIVWGTADGIKILDAVCPTDMREFVLDNFADSRIPLTMAKFEYSPVTDTTAQFLFIPEFEPNFIGPDGSPFTFRATKKGTGNARAWQMAGGSVVNENAVEPDDWEDWSFGFRWLQVYKGFEYTLNYLHGYDYNGAHYSRFDPAPTYPPGPIPPLNALHLQTKYERTDLYGGSFTKTITEGFASGLTIRGEFAYIHDVPGYYGTDGNPKGTVKVDNYNYVLGFDKYIVSNWLASFQFIQMISSESKYKAYNPMSGKYEEYSMLSGPTLGPISRVENFLSLKVATDFDYERIKPEILTIYGFDAQHIEGWWISPKIGFELTDNWTVNTGANIFEGDEQNLFGEFTKNDQVYVEVIFGF